MGVIDIRPAIPADADSIGGVLERSITALCVADHKNDPKAIADWLVDKSPQAIAANIVDPDYHLYVAVDEGKILGVCAMAGDGEVKLNYVDPDARFRGLSKTMMAHLEDRGRRLGLTELSLAATKTAHRFYLAAGYVDSGLPTEIYGIC